jgi:hypothetical protein
MSLSFEPENENSKHIANIYDGKKTKKIYINDSGFDFESSHNNKSGVKKIVLDNEKKYIFPIIHNYEDGHNDRIFVCGKSGCGKTYRFIRPYIIHFLNKYKGSKVYFFSSKTEDKAVDDLPIIRVKVDDNFVLNPPDIRKFSNNNSNPNLIVFDDIQDYKKKSYNNSVQQLRDEIARNGRSHGLYVIYLWHKPADRKNTEIQIFESTASVIFPKTSGHDDYDYMASRYLGVKPETMEILKRAKSNYVYITKSSPAVAISDKYIIVL